MLTLLAIYLAIPAVLAASGIHLWRELLAGADSTLSARPGWAPAARSYPAFAVSQMDFHEKTGAYQILRHPAGGRRDILRWAAAGGKAIAELEIYRPGREPDESVSTNAGIAARMGTNGWRELEGAGVIASKFGPISLLRPADADADDASSCLGFIKAIDDPPMRMSGWSCQGDDVPAGRAAIGCMLNRLILLTSGNEPKLAELFARAELRRGNCAAAALASVPADWVTGAQNPRLRGSL